MKKSALALITVFLFACSSTKTDTSLKPLYEVLTEQNNGGADIRFFEILTEDKEIKMLQSDENLKNKIKPDDIAKANFVILNLGEKSSGGHSIQIVKAEETTTQIILTIKENAPKPGDMVMTVMSNPYTIVKVNSKKEIVIKDLNQ